MDSKLSISAFFPCYNDRGTIVEMVTSALEILNLITYDHEVIVIDDGSTDGSIEILRSLESKYSNVKVMYHEKNLGYGAALKSGFKAAQKEYIFYTDGDAQYDVGELPRLLKVLKSDTDLVNGYKIQRSDPYYRKIIGYIYNHLVKFAFGIKLKDVDCDFRIIRRGIFNNIVLRSNSGIICVEMIKKIELKKMNIKEVPVNHHHRTYGKSQFFNFRRLIRIFFGLFFLWWRLIIKQEET